MFVFVIRCGVTFDMKYQLNPLLETLFLLISSPWGKEQKKDMIAEIDAIGLNGAAFYANHFPLVERYFAAFDKKRRKTDGDEILFDICQETGIILAAALWRHPEWVDKIEEIPEETLYEFVHSLLVDLFDDEKDVYKALEQRGYPDNVKWQISVFLAQPKQRLSSVFTAVRENVSACEHASAAFSGDLNVLFGRLEERLAASDTSSLFKIPEKMNSEIQIVPSLAVPLGIVVIDELGICGLLTPQLFTENNTGYTKREVLIATKALSDASKLEILLALREGSLYNLEIAKRTGLTPATTSHHMGMLLAAGLVELDKKDGKAYYSFSAAGLERYIAWLSDSLLK